MVMFQVLPKVVCTKELRASLIASSELMHVNEVSVPLIPIGRRVGEVVATVRANADSGIIKRWTFRW